MSKRQRLIRKCEKMNRQFPVGSRVRVRQDSGEILDTKVRSRFSVLGGHTVVGWFYGITGCYDADRTLPPKDI